MTLRLKEFFKYLDSTNRERIRVKLDIDNGGLTDVMLQYESLMDGK